MITTGEGRPLDRLTVYSQIRHVPLDGRRTRNKRRIRRRSRQVHFQKLAAVVVRFREPPAVTVDT